MRRLPRIACPFAVVAALAGAAASCSSGPLGSGTVGTAMVSGAVEKGPFILGSSVTASTLDPHGDPTGKNYMTQTTDDAGSFALANVDHGGVSLEADGFYYDEVRGVLSTAPITLRAFADVGGSSQAIFINVVTHLAYDRERTLMGQGEEIGAAIQQAEGELVTALGIGGSGFTLGAAGGSLSELGGDTDANAYLFALGAIFVQAAIDAAGPSGSVDATLQQLLATAASTLAPSGTLTPAILDPLHQAEREIDVATTEDLFAQRLASVGSSASVPDLDRVVDTDGDGYPNKTDTCPLVANPNQAVVPQHVVCRVTRHTILGTGLSGAFLGDLDGDGHMDALAMRPTSSMRLDGKPGGLFAPPVLVSSPLPFPGGSAPSLLFDVDGDHRADAVAANLYHQTSGWARGDGTGKFPTEIEFDSAIPGGPGFDCGGTCGYRGIALDHFNGTPYLDLVRVLNTAPGAPSYLCFNPGAGPGIWGQLTISPVPVPTLQSSGTEQTDVEIFAGDFDHDTKLDVILSWVDGLTPIHLLFVKGTANYTFGPYVDSTAHLVASNVVLGDVNGDGNTDAVISGNSGIWVMFGDGTGAFGPPVHAWAGAGGSSLATADVTGDGRPAILFTDADNQLGVIAYVNNAFAAPQWLRWAPLGNQPSRILIADLDGNGTPDIVLSGSSTSSASAQERFVSILVAP